MLLCRGVVEGAGCSWVRAAPPRNGAPVLMASDSRVKLPLSAGGLPLRAEPGGLQVSQQAGQVVPAEGGLVQDQPPVPAHNTTTPALLPSIPPL